MFSGFQKISTKLIIIITFIETITLGFFGRYFMMKFRGEIDSRFEKNARLPGELMNRQALTYDSARNLEALSEIVGEQVVEAVAISKTSKVLFSSDRSLENTFFDFTKEDWRDIGINKGDLNGETQKTKITRTRNGVHMFILSPFGFGNKYMGSLLLKIDINDIELRKKNIALVFMIGCALLLMISFLAIVLSLQYTISYPLNRLFRVIKAVESGNLTTKVALSRSSEYNEINIVSNAFNKMTATLSEIIKNTLLAVKQVTITSADLLKSSQQQAVSINEQMSAISQTSSSATELMKSAENIGESIKEVESVTDSVVAGLSEIKGSVDLASERITSLGDKSKQIGNITMLIDDIAERTNLLAINAAIEAARAGEHGKGFAVVADEIRKLSDSTSRSTQEIASLLEMIQEEISNAIVGMETIVLNVDQEMKLSEVFYKKTKEISVNTTQQVSGAQQIAQSIQNINNAMTQIMSMAEENRRVADELIIVGNKLKEIASAFKL